MNRLNASPYDLAADYKYHGIDRQASYSKFVIDRALKPEMDAKEFFEIYDTVEPCPYQDFIPTETDHYTHYDNLLNQKVLIEQRENNVFYMVWEDGHTGSNPPFMPPNPVRYVQLGQVK